MEKTVEDYIKELLEMRQKGGYSMPESTVSDIKNSDKTGQLIVSVTHSQNTYPLENAKVEVFDNAGNLLASEFTNSSGQTSLIKLPTVSKENSENFDNTKQVANYYTVVVSADGYVTTKIINVPIFEDITTSERVDMTFLAASSTGDSQTIVLSNTDRG